MPTCSSMEDRVKKGRTLEEVSHLFLSSQRPSNQAEKPIGKQGAQADGETIAWHPADLSQTETQQDARCTMPMQGNLCLLFCGSKRLCEEKSFLASSLAFELARRDFSVGLIETTATLPSTFFLFGGYKNIDAVFWERDLDSAGFLTIFDRLRSTNEFLIVNVFPNVFGSGKMYASTNPFFVVPTTVCSEELLKAYLLIKQICRDVCCPDIGLVIMGEDVSHAAAAACKLISQMAQKFLSCKIHFMGSIPKGTHSSQAIPTQTPLLQESAHAPPVRKMAERLIQKRSQPSERNLRW